MEHFHQNQWKCTGQIISNTGFPSLSPPFLRCLCKTPLLGIQVRCCHCLQAESGLNYLSLPLGRGENYSSGRKYEVGSILQLSLWTAVGFSRHMPQSWRRCGQGQVHRGICSVTPWDITVHPTWNQGPTKILDEEKKKKAKGREEIIASLLMFPIISASFRMSSVNNLYKASPIGCE